jgi:hypothetical protein
MTLDNQIVATASEYFAKVNSCDIDSIPVDWNETGDENLISIKQYNLIGEIISTQVAFWTLRRLRNSCESNCDYMRKIMKDKIKTYETQYGKFQDFNQENIW